MSNDTLQQETISALIDGLNWNRCYVAAFSLYVFDQWITSARQVEFVRQRRMSIATILMALLHVSAIITYVCWIASFSAVSCESGYRLNLAYGGALALSEFTSAVISALRVYAVTRREWRVSTLAFALGLPSVALEIYWCSTEALQYLGNSPSDCAGVLLNPKLFSRFNLAAIIMRWLGSLIVLLTTWRGTYGVKKMTRGTGVDTPIAFLLMRDGTLYFGCLLVLESLNIAASYVEKLQGFWAFSPAISTVLLIRFFLNLREAALVEGDTITRSHCLTDLQFSRGLGSLNGSLDYSGSFAISDSDDESGSGEQDDPDQRATWKLSGKRLEEAVELSDISGTSEDWKSRRTSIHLSRKQNSLGA